MSYNTLTIADAIIHQAKKQANCEISITKLHKLIYMTYGAYLYTYDKILTIEKPSAFQYGPIFKYLHYCYKQGDFQINKTIYKYNVSDEVLFIINKVLTNYLKSTDHELAKITQQPGSAWHTLGFETENWGEDIPIEYIYAEFSQKINTNNKPEENNE